MHNKKKEFFFMLLLYYIKTGNSENIPEIKKKVCFISDYLKNNKIYIE